MCADSNTDTKIWWKCYFILVGGGGGGGEGEGGESSQDQNPSSNAGDCTNRENILKILKAQKKFQNQKTYVIPNF